MGIFARLSKLDSDVDELKRNISEVDGKGNNMTLSIETLTNSFGDKLNELKTVNDKLDNKIDDLEKMLQQTQEKAKDEVDASISKNNAAVNEFRSEIENKVQNITIQYQDGLDKALEENNLLKNEISKMRDDANNKSNDLDDKLNGLIEDNKNNTAELINIKEANFEQQEKVKEAMSAKVDSLNEERQRAEKLIVERNEELIAKNTAAIRDLEKHQNDKLDQLEKDSKAGFEKTRESNNNLTVIVDSLKLESDELKEAIQDLNELMQEKEEKAKDEMEASATKNNVVINEFKTEMENKIQNITIQYQEKLDKSIAENNGLRNEFQMLKDDKTLSDMIEGLRTDNDEIKGGIQNMNLIIQQNESKAKDEADATLTKSNAIINEFKTNVENKVQNITIQYQDNIERVTQENNKLKEEIEKMKDDAETLGDVIESVQEKVNKLDINTSEKFESNEKVLQEINSYTTNIKMVMEADQANNTELIKKSIDDAKSTMDNQKKDMEDKLENYFIKFELGQKEMKDTIEKDSKNNLADIQDEINVIKGDILGNNNNTNAIEERISVLHSDLQKLDITQVETAEKIKEVTVLATNIDVYVKSQEEKLGKQKEEYSSVIYARLSKLDTDVDELKRNISEVDGKGNNISISIEALTNSFGDKLNDLKTVDDKLNTKIDDLEKMLEQNKEKAKDEVDASISKNNAAVNELRSE